MHPIETIAKERAELAAQVEYLSSLPDTNSDREERSIHKRALRKAQIAYMLAEEQLQRATSTLTSGELQELQKRGVLL